MVENKTGNIGDTLDELIDAIDDEMAGIRPLEGTEKKTDGGLSTRVGAAEQHILFSLSGSDYAFPIDNVLEVSRPPDITSVPNLPEWVLGVTNLRGDILSLVDLGLFLGLKPNRASHTARMVVLKEVGQDFSVGVIIDQVHGIRYLQKDRIGKPAAPLEGRVAEFIPGVYQYEGRLLGVFDCDRLLRSGEMRQFE